ncbi:hypothetical protein tloyanaT_20030 [Thalassotalea loyana]|uniref:Uncharacterized protein n=1 Tax=Thalassotalea loyana TaxID=280483 RepID=A0ABQ6HCD4_9GAMM|nr:hypothetical protein [Thalassotalea loyana]GLX85751.1 hypothetical protein tloyanaT_20030 [Thalassotalea loyana]
MKNHYLIEVTQTQKLFFSIEANSTKEAIEKALNQDNQLDEAMPPELDQITAKCIGGD